MDFSQHNVTLILNRWQQGDEQALDELITVVYHELRSLASAQLNRDNKASIQCTELVAEAYMKLVDANQINWKSRSHFLSVAARTMRRVLVERYRYNQAQKRGEGRTLLTFKDEGSVSKNSELALDKLDDVLTELEVLDARQAEIVTLKFFGGLKGKEIAEALSISISTVKREWQAARIWLYRELNK